MDAVARGAVGMGEMDSELVAGPERNGAGRTGYGLAGRNGTLGRCGYSGRTQVDGERITGRFRSLRGIGKKRKRICPDHPRAN